MKELTPEQEDYIGDLQYHEKKVRKNEKEVMDKVYDWWESLTEQKQFDIMLNWYPTEVHKDTDIDKMFGDMENKYQTEIYLGNNPEDEVNACLQMLNKDKRVMNIRSEYREEYKKYLKILDDREKRNLKPISFDDYLWKQSEKEVNEN